MTPPEGQRRRAVPKDRAAAASRGARVAPPSERSGRLFRSKTPQTRSRRSRRPARRLRQVSWVVAAAVLVAAGVFVALPTGIVREAAPVAPAKVEVKSDDTTATATWASGKATAFRVQYSENYNFADAQTQQVKRNTLALRSLVPGTTYFLRVRTVKGDKVSRPGRLVRFTTDFRYVAPKLVVDSKTSSSLAARWTTDAKKKDKVKYQAEVAENELFTDPTTKTVSDRDAKFTKLDRKVTYSVRVRVVDAQGVALSPWSETDTRQTARVAPLRVASFNVLKASDGNWSARRLAVAETILSQKIDVAGLQEATPRYVAGGLPQYADVARALGPDWAVTDGNKQGATGETRTVYNSKRLELVKNGYEEIPGSTRFGVQRYITWAIFKQKSTAKQFVFLNTHFVTSKARSRFGPRAAAAAQMVRIAKSVSGGKLPVIMAGDFNSAANRGPGNGVYRNITSGGYIDPLVQTGKLGAAKKLINADLKTVNKLARQPRRDASQPMIDHLFVSPMRVAEWETVAKLDGNGRVIGTIPSDHNMIRITVYLP